MHFTVLDTVFIGKKPAYTWTLVLLKGQLSLVIVCMSSYVCASEIALLLGSMQTGAHTYAFHILL